MDGLAESDYKSGGLFPSWNSTVNIALDEWKLNVGVRAEGRASPSYPPHSYIQNQNSENETADPTGCTLLFIKKPCSDWCFWLLFETGFEMNHVWGWAPWCSVYWDVLVLETTVKGKTHTGMRHCAWSSYQLQGVLGCPGIGSHGPLSSRVRCLECPRWVSVF